MPVNNLLLAILGYLILLLIFGLYARKIRASQSLKDFYLAGGSLGTFVLLLTLYATQYSANTMLVTPAEVVNQGMGMIMILGYMTALVVFYLTFAPQLYQAAKKHQFITPGDWIDFRFESPRLSLLANSILVLVSVNFLLAQMMAMGHVTAGITDGQIPYWAGVVFLGLVVVIIETIGGMQAVAWTDVLQGCMLLVGLGGLFIIVMPDTKELAEISTWLMENEPQKIQVPSGDFQIYWTSTVLMIGIGAAVYPQAIQRIYAANSLGVLKKALGAMMIMPLITVLILFLLGVISVPYYSGAENIPSDRVLPEMLNMWASESTAALVLTVLVIVGLLAAIMSTADSVLLSLSSIVAKDILGKSLFKEVGEDQLTRVGKIFSWVVMVIIVAIALNPKITLWGLIELKMQILIQTAPLYMIGVHSKRVTAKGMYIGLWLGLLFALATFGLGIKTMASIQVGLIGFGINVLACLYFSSPRQERFTG